MQVLQFNLGSSSNPSDAKQQAIINMTQIGWNNQTNINIINNPIPMGISSHQNNETATSSVYNTSRRPGGAANNINYNQQMKDLYMQQFSTGVAHNNN